MTLQLGEGANSIHSGMKLSRRAVTALIQEAFNVNTAALCESPVLMLSLAASTVIISDPQKENHQLDCLWRPLLI